jgi:tRNA-specific 2-thiouridylase
VELVTLGQRRGLGLAGGTAPRYVVDIDRSAATVTVGRGSDLLVAEQRVSGLAWADAAVTGEVLIQCSAHGPPAPAAIVVDPDSDDDTAPDADPNVDPAGRAVIRWATPQRRVAPGQAVVAYQGDEVVAGATAR